MATNIEQMIHSLFRLRWFAGLTSCLYTQVQRWWTSEAPWNSRVSNSCLSTQLISQTPSEQLIKIFMNIYRSSVALLSKPPPFSPKHPATILHNHPICVYHHFSWSMSSNSCWFVKITNQSTTKKHLLLHVEKNNNIHHFPDIQKWPSWNMLWSPIFTSPLLVLWHSQSLIVHKKLSSFAGWLAIFHFFGKKL